MKKPRNPKKAPDHPPRTWRTAGVCAALAALVFAAFGQTAGFDFVNFDDPQYIYENTVVTKGISLSNIQWAFTHVLVGHWHPLTTLVFMLNCQLFGLWAGGHHLVNVLLHAACAIFLFLALLELTGAFWRCAFVAAVFAIHPLRAESVAWIAECKDVLSGTFFMLTLWAYARYAHSKGRYAMVLVWFALGLLSKPMLVTLPCVLLLMDYWPLARLRTASQFPRLLLEKAPLFVLTALSSYAAIVALKAAREPTFTYPANAPIGFVAYLWKMIYPAHLATLYPLPEDGWPAWEVFNAILILAAISAAVWLLRRKEPAALTGWLWFIGMTVPVAGVMQTGDQAYADRYTYLPQIGIYIAVTWLAVDWAGRRWRLALAWVGGVILCVLLVVCWHQTTYWRDSETIWTHTIAITKDNYIANNDLGNGLLRQGRVDEAIAHYREALRIKPGYEEAHDDLGTALLRQGRLGEAIEQYHQSLALEPSNAKAHNNLGDALAREGRTKEAMTEYVQALAINPDLPATHNNLGNVLFQQGDIARAIAESTQSLNLDPTYADAQNSLAWMLSTSPDPRFRDGPRAVQLALAANRAAGGRNPVLLRTLAASYAEAGDFSNAVQAATSALQLASALPDPTIAASLRHEIQLYQAGHRFGNPQ